MVHRRTLPPSRQCQQIGKTQGLLLPVPLQQALHLCQFTISRLGYKLNHSSDHMLLFTDGSDELVYNIYVQAEGLQTHVSVETALGTAGPLFSALLQRRIALIVREIKRSLVSC